MLRLQRRQLPLEERSDIAFRPLHDNSCSRISVYSGPSGPIVTVARIMDNIRHGRPAGEGIPANALNDPNSP